MARTQEGNTQGTKTGWQSVDEYLAQQPAEARAVLQHVRTVIRRALPKAEEGISYQIPVYKIDGEVVVYFAGFKEHFSLYPVGDGAEVIAGLAPYRVSKGTLRFSLAERVPAKLITAFVMHRAGDAAERAARKLAKTSSTKPAAKKKAAPTTKGVTKKKAAKSVAKAARNKKR